MFNIQSEPPMPEDIWGTPAETEEVGVEAQWETSDSDYFGGPEETLDTIIIRSISDIIERNPDLQLSNKVVLKNGPQVYRVALHHEIRDKNTGELHHHSFSIKSYKKNKTGWKILLEKSITLDEDSASDKKNEASALATFIAFCLRRNFPIESSEFLVIPLSQNQINIPEIEDKVKSYLDLLSSERNIDSALSLFQWLGNVTNPQAVVESLMRVDASELTKVNTIIGLSTLKTFVEDLEANLSEGLEEYWQEKFQKRPEVITQIFSLPLFILKGKAYVGGKNINNQMGNIADFLVTNKLSRNSVIIEIKTPEKKLLGLAYRNGIFNISPELTGSVVQVLSYRNSLITDYDSLSRNSDATFKAFDPKCLIIIGKISELDSPSKLRSFELYRSSLNNIQIVTFDEVIEKCKDLIAIIEGTYAGINEDQSLDTF